MVQYVVFTIPAPCAGTEDAGWLWLDRTFPFASLPPLCLAFPFFFRKGEKMVVGEAAAEGWMRVR